MSGEIIICCLAPYVIPVGRKLKNVDTVAKANGDFTDPVAAVNSITDASATNPYLVVICPGVYTITQTLMMIIEVYAQVRTPE